METCPLPKSTDKKGVFHCTLEKGHEGPCVFREGTKIEFDFGPNDVLLVESDHNLSPETADRLRDQIDELLKKPGPVSLILAHGFRAKVLHR